RIKALVFYRRKEAADFVVGITPLVEQRLAKHQALRCEAGAVGAQRVKRVRFVHEAGDGDAHGKARRALSRFVRLLQPGQELSVNVARLLHANTVRDHRVEAAGGLQPVGRRHTFQINANIDAGSRGRLDYSELSVAPAGG